jgi:hypothetical protein
MYFFQVKVSHVLRFISICDLFTDSPSYIRVYLSLFGTCVNCIRG